MTFAWATRLGRGGGAGRRLTTGYELARDISRRRAASAFVPQLALPFGGAVSVF